MKDGAHYTKAGYEVKVKSYPIHSGLGALEYQITEPGGWARYYHERHPRLEEEFQNLLNDCDWDGNPKKMLGKPPKRPQNTPTMAVEAPNTPVEALT